MLLGLAWLVFGGLFGVFGGLFAGFGMVYCVRWVGVLWIDVIYLLTPGLGFSVRDVW